MRKSNYDKSPSTEIEGRLWKGWSDIREELGKAKSGREKRVMVVECYQGVYLEEVKKELQALHPDLWIDAQSVFKSVDEVSAMTYPYVTDDRLFGYRAHFKYEDFMNPELLASAQKQVKESTGFVLVYGQGATLIAPEADL